MPTDSGEVGISGDDGGHGVGVRAVSEQPLDRFATRLRRVEVLAGEWVKGAVGLSCSTPAHDCILQFGVRAEIDSHDVTVPTWRGRSAQFPVGGAGGARGEVFELVGEGAQRGLPVLEVGDRGAHQRRRPSEWSTVELRGVEDRLLDRLNVLAARHVAAVPMRDVRAAIAVATKTLGDDQVEAVRVLCGAGSSVRLLVAPAGDGKTTSVHAAATAARAAGRPIIALAPTHKAVAELRAAVFDVHTIARFRVGSPTGPLRRGRW